MKLRKRLAKVLSLIVFFSVCGVAFAACGGPQPDVYTILPNETGFLVPLSDTSAQAKFQSVKYLQDKQVAAHQIVIQFHSISNNNGGQNYYPDDLLILVDRSSVTRNWVGDSADVARTDQAFSAQSADGVSFKLNSSCTGQITEADAAAYLYNFKGAPGTKQGSNTDLSNVDSLPFVMDNNVWGFLQDRISTLYGSVSYKQILTQKGDLFKQAVDNAVTFFGAKGLEISSCGLQGGPHPDNPDVAAAFGAAQIQQTNQIKADAGATTQAINNVKDIAQAQAKATADTTTNQVQINFLREQASVIQSAPALTQYILATKSNGQGPSVILGGSNVYPTYQIPMPTPTAATP